MRPEERPLVVRCRRGATPTTRARKREDGAESSNTDSPTTRASTCLGSDRLLRPREARLLLSCPSPRVLMQMFSLDVLS